MANREPIERLYIKLEADVRDLLAEGEKAIRRLEHKMHDLDKAGKRVGRFSGLKKGLDALVNRIRQVQMALLALGAALVVAFRMAGEAVRQLRIERSFFRLAAAANQSGNDILTAMRRASKGAIDNIRLMQRANLALQLGVAKTPEEFEKLTKAAIALGAAVGRGPVEALDDLITAAGRRSVMVLDNLGLALSEVNVKMEEFAQQDFGTTVKKLNQIQRNLLFTKATIEVANRKAEQLGANLADAGTSIERMGAQTANLKAELGKTSLVFISLLNSASRGPGILERLTQGAIAWQYILVQVAALIMAINDALAAAFGRMKTITDLLTQPLTQTGLELGMELGERLAEGMEEAGDQAGFSFRDALKKHLDELEEHFIDVLDPEAAAGAGRALPGPIIDEESTQESADDIQNILRDLTNEMLSAADDRQQTLEDLEQDHNQRIADIAESGARKRADIDRRLQEELADLARDAEKQRKEIIGDAEEDLADLARDTDEKLRKERDNFQIGERRATEDHLRQMRRLSQDYLFDIENAIKERDARAIVDLQRQFKLEQQRRQEDFGVRWGRERGDFDARLREIREYEGQRRQEILKARTEQLYDLIQNEAGRRAELQRSRDEQMRQLEENLAIARAREINSYQERRVDLDEALKERLAAIARSLSDEENINAQYARRLLTLLNKTFGAGGDIDRLMQDFAARRRQRMIVEIGFETITSAAQRVAEARQRIRQIIPHFQSGGTLVANKPTLALFGEAGPEVAQFIPMNQMRRDVNLAPQKLIIEFTGSAPPGIRANERDQIAGILLSALRESGALQR